LSISLVLADDYPLALGGLQSLLAGEPDMEVLDCCADGPAAQQAVQTHRPDILALDIRMPRLSRIAVLQELRDRGLRTRPILLAAEMRSAQVAEATRLDGRGVVLKEMAPDTPVQCIRTVNEGGQWSQRRALAEAVGDFVKQSRGRAPSCRPARRARPAQSRGRPRTGDQRRHGEDPPAQRLPQAQDRRTARPERLRARPRHRLSASRRHRRKAAPAVLGRQAPSAAAAPRTSVSCASGRPAGWP